MCVCVCVCVCMTVCQGVDSAVTGTSEDCFYALRNFLMIYFYTVEYQLLKLVIIIIIIIIVIVIFTVF